MAFSATLNDVGERILPPGIVPFPRGFAFSGDGALLLASGIGPNGEGDNSIVAFAQDHNFKPSRLVSDPELGPLDLAIAPNGNIVVSSEHPFGLTDAITSVRAVSRTRWHRARADGIECAWGLEHRVGDAHARGIPITGQTLRWTRSRRVHGAAIRRSNIARSGVARIRLCPARSGRSYGALNPPVGGHWEMATGRRGETWYQPPVPPRSFGPQAANRLTFGRPCCRTCHRSYCA